MILNLGCGNDPYGDVRLDLYRGSANIIADIEVGLPFRDRVFDAVYAKFIFEHVRNPSQFLQEIYRVVRPGGRLELMTDNAGYWRHYFPTALHYHGRGVHDRHYATYTVPHIQNHLQFAGFMPLRVGYADAPWTPHKLDRLFRRLHRLEHLAFPRIRVIA